MTHFYYTKGLPVDAKLAVWASEYLLTHDYVVGFSLDSVENEMITETRVHQIQHPSRAGVKAAG